MLSQARDDLPLLPPSLEQQEKLCGKQVSRLVCLSCMRGQVADGVDWVIETKNGVPHVCCPCLTQSGNLSSTSCKANGNLFFQLQGMASRSLQIQIEELMKMRCDLERVSGPKE